jgi:hypothetical protein
MLNKLGERYGAGLRDRLVPCGAEDFEVDALIGGEIWAMLSITCSERHVSSFLMT